VKIALVGNTVTEEALADVIHHQSPGVQVDGFPTVPNAAFSRAVDEDVPLFRITSDGELEPKTDQLPRLLSAYDARHVSGPGQLEVVEKPLNDAGQSYIGPTSAETVYEADKTKIFEVFPPDTEVLPPTRVLETSDPDIVKEAIDDLGGDVVAKFVGDYGHHFDGSAAGRTRVLGESDPAGLREFAEQSVLDSGRILLQRYVPGRQFSYTCLLDGNGAVFRLGENICYKHRFDGETGPLCDGTGAVTIDNTVPGLVTPEDVEWITNRIVLPFRDHVERQTGRSPKTFLNIDLIKASNGRLYLLEINTRAPGGNTMANLISGLETPVAEMLQAAQEGRLSELTPVYKRGASVVVAVFPTIYPAPYAEGQDEPTLVLPKVAFDSRLRLYTGWVDVLDETSDAVTVSAKLYTTMVVSLHGPSVRTAADEIYEWLATVVPPTTPDGFDYRRDIGASVERSLPAGGPRSS
jgi:phosphoribosylamine-glycine ligase